MEVFRTTSVDVITECQHWFGLPEMETLIVKRKQWFSAKFAQCGNVLMCCVNCSLMLTVCLGVTYDNLGTICLIFIYSVCPCSCFLSINIMIKAD